MLNLAVLKLSPTRIVWTAHHTKSHETVSDTLDWIGRQALFLFANHIFVLATPVKDQILSEYYFVGTISVANLGNYKELHEERQRDGDLATEIPDEKPVVSMIGLIRPYKRTPLGIQSFEQSEAAAGMLIAGKPTSDEMYKTVKESAASISKQVTIHPEYISDLGLVQYVEQSDIVLVLNDQDTVPATAYLAAACHTPIVTISGGIKEYLATEYNVGVVAQSVAKEDIAAKIDEVLSNQHTFSWEKFDNDHQWDDYRDAHYGVYRLLVDGDSVWSRTVTEE